MKEHIISDKIDFYKKEVVKRPLAHLPNMLLLTYLALGKQYADLTFYTEQFLMNNASVNLLAENFSLLGSLGVNEINKAKTIFKNIVSIDPENEHAHLLMSTVDKNNLPLAYMFLPQLEKKRLAEYTKKEIHIPDQYKFYRIPDIIGIKDYIPEKIAKALKDNPMNPILKVSYAEAMLKLGDIDKAEKELLQVLAIYPNYPRALYLYAKIEGDYKGDDKKSLSTLNKIFKINPVSQYLKGTEVLLLDEKDNALENELKNLFDTENPFIKFFQERFKEEEKEEKTKKEETVKIEEEKIPEDPIEKGFSLLYKGDYEKAIEQFLEEIKKK